MIGELIIITIIFALNVTKEYQMNISARVGYAVLIAGLI
jgi:hypothetical protein